MECSGTAQDVDEVYILIICFPNLSILLLPNTSGFLVASQAQTLQREVDEGVL